MTRDQHDAADAWCRPEARCQSDRTALLAALLPTPRLKLLFGAACCREVEEGFTAKDFPRSLLAVEEHADQPLPMRLVPDNVYLLNPLCESPADHAAYYLADAFRWAADGGYPFTAGIATAAYTAATVDPARLGPRQRTVLKSFVRQPLPPTWKTGNTVGLAQAVYGNRHHHLTPILADALQDAGCDDHNLLAGLRDPAFPAYRGNNLLDFLRGGE